MKKLFLLYPLALWIADYFIWAYADKIGVFSAVTPDASQVWWIISVVVSGVITLVTVVISGIALLE